MTHYTTFKTNAVKEIQKIDQDAVCETITLTVTEVITKLEKLDFTKRLMKENPIFIRHIMPIDCSIELSGEKNKDLPRILHHAQQISSIMAGDSFTVQARVIKEDMEYNARDIEVFIGEVYENLGGNPVYSEHDLINDDIKVISVFITEDKCHIGYSKTSENLNFQSNEYRLLGKEHPDICRAENKLKEAICKFKIDLKGSGYALDIGAAPGGWTKVLADLGYQVIAVDPGTLDKRLSTYPNITHYKAHIQDVVITKPLSLVTCDMNMDTLIAAKMMCELHDKLKEGSYCIITLKLPYRDEEQRIQKSVDMMKPYYDILEVKNLTHNRREVTVFMKYRKQECKMLEGEV